MKLFYVLLLSLFSTGITHAQKSPWAMPNFDSLHKGQLYQPFSIVSLDGKTLDNASCTGKVTFISFWFEGCAGCRAEFAQVNALYDSLKNDPNYTFIALTYDDAASLLDFIKANNLHFPIATTGNNDQFEKLNYGMGCPSVIILDKDTRIALIGMKALTDDTERSDFTISQAIAVIRKLE